MTDRRRRAPAAPRTAPWRRTCLLGVLLLGALLVCAPVHADVRDTVVLRAGANRAELAAALGVFEAPVDADLATVRAAFNAGRFRAVDQFPPTYGFADGTHWFHLRVRNADHPEPDWILSVAYALLDRLTLHVVRDDGRVERLESGDRVPFDRRALAHRHPNFAVWMGEGERVDLFLRVESQSSVQVPLELQTSEAFLQRAPAEHLGLGLYYGIMLGLFCYNLVLWLSVRDRTFLFYVLYVAAFAAGQLCLNGLAFQYLWPAHPDWANDAVLVSVAIGMASMLLFTRAFLDLRRRFPAADRAAWVVIAVLGLVTAAVPVLGYRDAIRIETALVFVIAALILTAAVRGLRAGFRPAAHFLVAWGVLLAGVMVYAALSFGLLPKVFLTEYGIQIGSAAEMILLSFALAYRINALREENARIQREAHEQLETRVAERTRDLDDANRQLQSANRTLQEFSLRDGLTGAWNRRCFDQTLDQVWREALASGRPLSLVMADIDHFKRINDQHGHLVGDDCLRALSQCLARAVDDASARVARYGGEEFFVILPDTDARAAEARAEALRQAVAGLSVPTEAGLLSFTVSVGVATFRPDSRLAHADLLRATDRALYEAKRRGRNCVVVGAH